MTVDIAITLAVIVLAVILFFTEIIEVELTAMVIMGLLIISKVITPQEGISGFSNPATVTVGAMFVLSAGLYRTGALNFFGELLLKANAINQWLFLILLTLVAGVMSAFINDTAVVALLIPVVLKVAGQTKTSPSKLLMPLSFCALFGGVCTLIGTSTNILVSSIAEANGEPAFGMFTMAPFGIVVLITGVIYMVIAAMKWIPDRGTDHELSKAFGMGEYLTEIVLQKEAKSLGQRISESTLVKELDVVVLQVTKGKSGVVLTYPFPDSLILEEGDILKIQGYVNKIKELQERVGIKLKSSLAAADGSQKGNQLVEAIISPSSILIDSTLKEIDFRTRFGATVLAIRHREEILNKSIGRVKLKSGDVLLIDASKAVAERLKRSQDFVVVSDPGLPVFRKDKILIALLIVAGVIASAASGLAPILSSAIVGCILLIVTKCIKIEECYRAVEWKVIFLLAGVLSMGVALERSGAAALISQFMVGSVGQFGNRALVSAFFLLTLILTNFMSNNATAALLAPIAIITARSLELNALPFLMTITFAASLSLITPVGYQTNTMIYGPGRYRFSDFTKIGLPLDIIFWILATWLIPVFYPF